MTSINNLMLMFSILDLDLNVSVHDLVGNGILSGEEYSNLMSDPSTYAKRFWSWNAQRNNGIFKQALMRDIEEYIVHNLR